jgi:GGDEF domain-containing protein
MSGGKYVARSTDVAARRLGDEMVILSARDSMLFTLNDAAAKIWEAADGKTRLDEIVAKRICAEFDIAPDAALKDAEELAEQLASQDILVISERPIGVASAAAGSSR